MWKIFLRIYLLPAAFFLTFLDCSNTPQPENVFASVFNQYAVEGTFVMQELHANKTYFYNKNRSSIRFIPASTFKILNSLIALETGAIVDTNVIIKWDGIERSIKPWNRDHNMRTAIQVSAVWFYQELARRIGEERMQDFVNKADYGNKDISGAIDLFWLDGGLRISAQEQVHFLKKLYENNLPFSPPVLAKVKDILVVDQGPDYVLRAKTGWGGDAKPQIGWYVGYLEKGSEVYFFALNIDINKDEDSKARVGIVRKIFHDLRLLE